MKYIVLIALLICVVCVENAHADPAHGLWAQEIITVDGVQVRKVLDNSGNSYNVCYVATHTLYSPSVSISCVAEKKP